MQIYHGLPASPLPSESTLTIGVFDGVHRGHQLLIGHTLRHAREMQRLCGVLTFDPHPVEVLAPDARIQYLSDIDERARLIEQLGADYFCVIPFTVETSQTSARDFVRPLLDRLRMRDLFIGYDFTLGHRRQGNAEFLRALGAEWGFTLTVVEPLVVDGAIVSSTRIRKLLSEGKVEKAARLLGHLAIVKGTLKEDDRLSFSPKWQIPADGFYACQIGEATLHAPTFDCTALIEQQLIHLRDRDEMRALVDKDVRVQFVKRRDGSYEEIEHTADVALRVRAPTLEGLLTKAAEGMFTLMTDVAQVPVVSQREIEVEGADPETLLVNWLSELLYQAEIHQQTYRAFEVSITEPHHLKGVARGGPSGEIRKQIKAVTFHDLHIKEHDGQLETTIVFDV